MKVFMRLDEGKVFHLEFGCYEKHIKHALFQPPYLEGIDLDIFRN